MKKATGLLLLLLFAGCQTFGMGQPDQATRILADINCVTTAIAAGLQIAGDPALNGGKSAVAVLNAILAVGTSNVPASVLAACKDTLAYASQDAAGALALVKGSDGSTGTKVSPPPTARAAVKQPQKPTPVVIPLSKKK